MMIAKEQDLGTDFSSPRFDRVTPQFLTPHDTMNSGVRTGVVLAQKVMKGRLPSCACKRFRLNFLTDPKYGVISLFTTCTYRI